MDEIVQQTQDETGFTKVVTVVFFAVRHLISVLNAATPTS